MKITHSTKVKASEDFVVDYKIPDDPEYWKREEKKRLQRELADEADYYDLEHEEGIYSSDVACAEDEYITDSYGRKVRAPKPVGGDGKNYISYYTGHGYAGPKEILEDAKQRGFSKMYWGSDESYGMHGMYNGDMYIAYNDAEVLPKGYKEDALDAEAHNRVMSSSIIEGATQEEIEQAFADYQKKQQDMMMQLDDLQDEQIARFNKRTQPKGKKRFFRRAFAANEARPSCHKISEDEDTINYIVSSEDVTASKWMGKYLTPSGEVKHVYFNLDSEDWNEAVEKLENIIPEPYQSAKLLGKAPADIELDPSFSYIEGASRTVTGHLIGEIQAQLHHEIHTYLVDTLGFDAEDDPDDIGNIPADSIFVVEVDKTDDGAVRAEVRAELGYESMDKLADILNDKVIQKYDPDAYFEQVDPGIMEAFLFMNDVEGSTKVIAASPVSDSREHWLEPEEDSTENIEEFDQEVEFPLDVDIIINDDGSYDYADSYFAANPDSKNGDWYIEYEGLSKKVLLRDLSGVLEDLDELLIYKIPDATGRHHISGNAVLVYNVSGLDKGPDGEVYDDRVKVRFDRNASHVDHFKLS